MIDICWRSMKMGNNKCFVDTGAFVALNNERDQHYTKAFKIAKDLIGFKFVMTDPVVHETYTTLRYRLGFHKASQFLNTIQGSDEFDIIDITPSLRRQTQALLEKYNDHKISYCDALSVAVMNANQIEKVFAFDHHFDVMGVERIY
jgi:predicted nucleic acid-binding protein